MAWKGTDRVSERMRFISAWMSREEAVTALAVRFGVSRKTAYNRQRYDGHPAGDLSSWVASPLNAHPIASSALSS